MSAPSRTQATPAPPPQRDQEAQSIRVQGAQQHNLKAVNVAIPRGKLSVVSGVSGSGKSSLAFATIYAEGQRRYVESFSTYARQFLERMDRPKVETIDGLLPAIAIEQRNSIRSARATLGSLSETTDYLKLIFAADSQLHCQICQAPVLRDAPGPTATALIEAYPGSRAVVTFPFHLGQDSDRTVALRYLQKEGFRRVFVEGRVLDLEQVADDQLGSHSALVVDRLVLNPSELSRLTEALELAYRMGDERLSVHVFDADMKHEEHQFSQDLRHCGHSHPEPRSGLFSFNSPVGACPDCNGFGRIMGIDMDRVIPDRTRSLNGGAIRPWRYHKRARERRALRQFCDQVGIDLDIPFNELGDTEQRLVLEGQAGGWLGVRGWFKRLERKSYKMHVRVLLARYRAYLTCPTCEGSRFKPEALYYRLGGRTIAESLTATVTEARAWLSTLSPSQEILPVYTLLEGRLAYLERVGLGYLRLDRQARTLSGGELQRANLTTAVGSGLVNTLFVLDEPSIGLHPRDSTRLAEVLAELTQHDNTVVLVEHDPDMMRHADHLIEMGPGPGPAGGEVMYAGPPQDLALRCPDAATARALACRSEARSARSESVEEASGIRIRGAGEHNLKHIDVTFPYRHFTVLCGVSGSGKSTLLEKVLYRGALRQRGELTDPPGIHDSIEGLDGIREIIWIDQAAPVSSPRANAATYVKAWDTVRKNFACQALSQSRGYTAGTFSFNTGPGRCPACQGAGFERVEMQFLADVYLTCGACEGKRFKPEVLEVQWQGRSVADVLAGTVDETIALLGPKSPAGRRLKALTDVGLGYLRLGQPLSTLSGGESQRLKIAHHLGLQRTTQALFLLDEPTTGLHLLDVDTLIKNLKHLASSGNTVVVIEHHLEVLAQADHIIELGPEGGERGGQVVFTGSPAQLLAEQSPTGPALKAWLGGLNPFQKRDSEVATSAESEERITIKGARVHNLKELSVSIPRRGRTVISGVSGSGKSSLAFDLIFAEGQRRFLDCLSSYARQYLNQLARPDADLVAGIPPTVAIEQRTTRGGARSTVANVTEIEPFLRLLFARLGELQANKPMNPAMVAASIRERWPGETLTVFAPAVSARKGFHKRVFEKAARLGHSHIVVDGRQRAPEPPPRLRRNHLHTIDYIVAVGVSRASATLEDVLMEACRLSGGEVSIGPDAGLPDPAFSFMVEATAENTPRQTFDPRHFSAHTELGACPECKGSGSDDDGQPCAACEGSRLGAVGRTVRFAGYTLPKMLSWRPQELLGALDDITLDSRSAYIAEGPIQALRERTQFLIDVGLGYLSLDRMVRSLSGGEAQRIRLAAQLGAELSGVLYVLDEPTIGLHPTDVDLVLKALDRLQARGNGVLMVEHDESTIRSADLLIDMGPGAGVEGGELLAYGTLDEILHAPNSITGRCLKQQRPPTRAKARTTKGQDFIALSGVHYHNLKGLKVRFPRGRLTVVTGVSGSGKSSLVHDVLPAALTQGQLTAGRWSRCDGIEGLKRVVRVDDKPIGKNPRSIPATYIGVWDDIRKLFAALPEAKVRGYKAKRFSFNVKGGRCETCQGQGAIKLEMSFLPKTFVPCDLCNGRRFNRETLRVTYEGHSIHDVLELPIRDALVLFDRIPRIKRALSLLVDVGLGYLKLGQPSPTLSGGEAQRIKLVSQLLSATLSDRVIVLDEPTIGLHMADIPRLLEVIHRLVDGGATVVVIEHNPDVMREADWIVDLGPGPADEGGRVVYQGPFEGLAKAASSRTGQWLVAHGLHRNHHD